MGKFPLKNKSGERFLAVAANSPFYDDHGIFIGIICVSSDLRCFREVHLPEKISCQQPLSASIAEKFSNLVSFVVFFFFPLNFDILSKIYCLLCSCYCVCFLMKYRLLR